MLIERIRDLREDRDLIQQQVAAFLRVYQTSYSRYELGKVDVPADVLCQLADFYGVSVDYLLDRTDGSTPYPKK